MYGKNKKHVYCINVDCSKKDKCLRYNGDAGETDMKRKYEEEFNGVPCQKFILKKDAPHKDTEPWKRKRTEYTREDMHSTAFYSSNSKENLLRETMLLEIEKNFDALFMTEMTFRGAEFYNINRIATRVVDRLMPIIVSADRKK